MFGYHRRKREIKRMKNRDEPERENAPERRVGNMNEINREHQAAKDQKAADEKRQDAYDQTAIDKRVEQSGTDRDAGRVKGRAYAEELLERDVKGLSPEKRKAMQYEANRGIERDMQSSNRKLLGDQAQRGISGKSGVAYAQQRDLHRTGTEAKSQVQRDLDKMDADLALKKKAAMLAIEQGEASQAGLDRQQAIDEMGHANERKRIKNLEEKYYQNFSRV